MEHHWVSPIATLQESEILALPRSTPRQRSTSKRTNNRKAASKYISLVIGSGLVLVLALFAAKLVTTGLTAVLWGWVIFNLACLLGGLVSGWENQHTAKVEKRKAPVHGTKDSLTFSTKSPSYQAV